MTENKQVIFVVVGGGIGGVSCAESLAILKSEQSRIILITESPLVKIVTNVKPLAKFVTQFDIEEIDSMSLRETLPTIEVIVDKVISVDEINKAVTTLTGKSVNYTKLCICTGARPKLISDNEHVIGIRDTDSVTRLEKLIKSARRVAIIGNGGIATELVHELESIDITWIIRDKHISATFIDPAAASFFQEKSLNKTSVEVEESDAIIKRMKYSISSLKIDNSLNSKTGAALGPDWHAKIDLKGLQQKQVSIEYGAEVKEILSPEQVSEKYKDAETGWSIYVLLTNGKVIGADFVISATGVTPINPNLNCQYADDGGIKVNWKMESSIQDIYAAGDAASCDWEFAKHWFQMRLWSQARIMGSYAAKSMIASINNEELLQDFAFELFTHVTNFFGMKVVLLGLYNSQKLNSDYELLLRVTKNVEYVKLVLQNGRLQGAVLIGETDLEEMCENLILNQLDLSDYGEDLLNPNIDIDDYFD